MHERKKPKILKVVSDDSDSESDSSSEEEIEEITTEGKESCIQLCWKNSKQVLKLMENLKKNRF